MLKWIIEKIQGVSISQISDMKSLTDPADFTNNTQFWNQINEFILSIELKDIQDLNVLPDGETLAAWFQKSLDAETRKIFAANYTSIATIEILKSIFSTTVPINIIDPF